MSSESSNPLAKAGTQALVAIMVAGSLVLWVVVPFAWLWIGSQLQESTGLSTALAVTFFGAVGSILAVAYLLGWVNLRHRELREAQTGRPAQHGVLGPILAATAAVAVALFAVWFLLIAGLDPTIKLGY